MADWSKLFEREYGHAPSEIDRIESDTYNALLEKARHYRKISDEGDATVSTARRPPKARHPEKLTPRNASTPARRLLRAAIACCAA